MVNHKQCSTLNRNTIQTSTEVLKGCENNMSKHEFKEVLLNDLLFCSAFKIEPRLFIQLREKVTMYTSNAHTGPSHQPSQGVFSGWVM